MKEKETEKERDFLILMAETGVADFIYSKSSRPPRYANQKERTMWNEGYLLAKRSCQR